MRGASIGAPRSPRARSRWKPAAPIRSAWKSFQRTAQGDERLLWSTPSDQGALDALAAARDSDLVVFVAGLSHRVEGEEMSVAAEGFLGGDRTSLDLPAPQQQLLERVVGVGKPVVLVLMNGSALSVNWADAHVPAIIEAWYPGGQGGEAVARLIAGDFSPAGRLPVTFNRSVGDLPPVRRLCHGEPHLPIFRRRGALSVRLMASAIRASPTPIRAFRAAACAPTAQ